MKTVKIYGASDDLVEVEGQLRGCDEFNAFGDTEHIGNIQIATAKDAPGYTVAAVYTGCWSFAVAPIDEDMVPDWPVRRSFGQDVRYSETVEIDCPDNATVRFFRPQH